MWKKGAPFVDSVRGRFRTISVSILACFFIISYQQYNQLVNDDEDGDDLLFEIENVDDQVFPLVPDSMVDSSALESIPESTAESRAADPLGATYRDDPHDSDEDLLVQNCTTTNRVSHVLYLKLVQIIQKLVNFSKTQPCLINVSVFFYSVDSKISSFP